MVLHELFLKKKKKQDLNLVLLNPKMQVLIHYFFPPARKVFKGMLAFEMSNWKHIYDYTSVMIVSFLSSFSQLQFLTWNCDYSFLLGRECTH